MDKRIDWALLSRAQFWFAKDFAPIEVPWLVTEEATKITYPKGAGPFSSYQGDLLGSGEQGFLQLILEGQLKGGYYSTITPCFRDDQTDIYHSKHFMKLELINIAPINPQEEFNIDLLQKAVLFYRTIINPNDLKMVKKTDSCYDLELNGIEVGSYGRSRYKDFVWDYGTGLALPRFSQAASLTPRRRTYTEGY